MQALRAARIRIAYNSAPGAAAASSSSSNTSRSSRSNTTSSAARIQGDGKCSICSQQQACIVCCGAALCLMHAHCSSHSAHEGQWTVINKALLKKDAPAVKIFVEHVTRELETELAAAEQEHQRRLRRAAAAEALRRKEAAAARERQGSAKSGGGAGAPLTFAQVMAAQKREAEARKKQAQAAAAAKPKTSQSLPPSRKRATPHAAAKTAPTAVSASTTKAPSTRPPSKKRARRSSTVPPAAASSASSTPPRSSRIFTIDARGMDGSRAERHVAKQPTAPATGDKHRDRVAEMVGDALRVDPAKPGGLDVRLSVAAVTSLGRQIEAHLIKRHGAVCQAYNAHVRTLVFNLRDKKNAGLRDRILAGELAPVTLVQLEPAALANPQVTHARKVQAALAKRTAEEAAGADMIPSDDFTCPHCGHKKTKFSYLSSVRDIGKSETWGSSSKEDVVLRVLCLKCGATWDKTQ